MASGGTDLPMSDFHRKVLKKGLRELVDYMKAGDLLNQLISDDCLSLTESKKIESQNGIDEQNKELVVTLLHGKPDRAYECFLAALEENSQGHVAKIVREKEVEVDKETRARQSTRQPLQEASTQSFHPSSSRPALTEPPDVRQRSAPKANLVPRHNPLTLVLPQRGGKASTKERQQRKVAGAPPSKPVNTHTKDGCMVGVKVSVYQLRVGDEDWIDGSFFEHILELEAFIWMILSMNFKDIDSPYNSHEIAQCFRRVGVRGREVMHVGFQPVQFIVHCPSGSALEQLGEMNKSTLAESLEAALMSTFLKEKYNLAGLTLETDIHRLEYGLCERILKGEVHTIGLCVNATSADGTPLMIDELNDELLGESVRQSSANDTLISNAMNDLNSNVQCVKTQSVLFTLSFTATEDLEVFRGKLKSGRLTKVFEKALLTEDMRMKYRLDSLNLSLTLSNPWEYEMCWVELAFLEDRKRQEDSTEDTSARNLADNSAFEAEGSDNELHRCCFEKLQLIEHLQKENMELKEKCSSLQQALDRSQVAECSLSAVLCPHKEELESQASEEPFDTCVENGKRAQDGYADGNPKMDCEVEEAAVEGELCVQEQDKQVQNMEKLTQAFTENTKLRVSGSLDKRSYIRRLRKLLHSDTLLANCADTALQLKGLLHSSIASQMVEKHEMMDSAREMDRAKCATSHRWLFQINVWEFERRFADWLFEADNVKNSSEELFGYMHDRLRVADELCDSNPQGAIVEYSLSLRVATNLWKNGLFLNEVSSESNKLGCNNQPVSSEFLARLYTSRAQTAFGMLSRVVPGLSGETSCDQDFTFWFLVLPTICLRDIEEAINYSGQEDARVFILAAKIYRFHQNNSQALKFAKSALALDPENEEIKSFLIEMKQFDSSSQAANAQAERKATIQDDYLRGTNLQTIQVQRQRRQNFLWHREQNKKQRKTIAMKLVPKRGQLRQQALESILQPIRSVQSGTIPKRNIPKSENVKRNAKLRDARKTSLNSLDTIVDSYDIKLACQLCCLEDRGFQGLTTSNTWAYKAVEHECREDIALLRPWSINQNRWDRVRQCPPNANVSNGICERNKLGEICKERPCPYPHNEAEEYVWSRNILVEPLMSDLRSSNLRLRSTLMSFSKRQDGVFDFVCKICTSSNPENLSENKKERHRPACAQGHIMHGSSGNELMCFFPEEGNATIVHPDHERAEGSASEVTAVVKDMISRGFTPKEIIDETKRLRQSEKEINKKKTLQHPVLSDRHWTLSQSNRVSTHQCRSEAQVPVLDFDAIVDGHEEELEWLSNDVLANADAIDKDEEVDFTYEKATYYEVYDTEVLYQLLKSNPGQFKHCVIHTEGSQQANCTTLDGQKVIEIRGRMNCGPTFEEDEVLVEILETPQLDKNIKVIRGKVVGVLKRRVNRKAHIFLCTVDSFFSNLMIPLCGTCPKIHVLDSYTDQTYGGEKKNNYVDVYELTTKPELRKVVKIDPAKKEQLLFVVKYLKWGPSHMYPLGYVCSVVPAGQDMKTGQKLLNLIHQIPGLHTEEVESYVKLQETQYKSVITEEGGRQDLTHEVVFSVDPEGCMEIDDALSVFKNTDDTYSVGVHIADVSSFVTEGDIVDEDARRRATSFYGADPSLSYPMLPTTLSHDLCSLLPNKKRCALSVLFLISADGKLQKQPEIKKTWIQSAGKLSYTDAQRCILGQACGTLDKDISLKVQLLHRLAQAMRRNRLGDAVFFVDTSDLANEDVDAHRLVEEFMLLANRGVARFLMGKFKTCTPLCIQDHPRADSVSKWKQNCLEAALASFYFKGFPGLLPESCKKDATGASILVLSKLAKMINESVEQGNPREVCNLFGAEAFHPLQAIARMRWLEIQNQARLVASGTTDETSHFALQLKFYTQFTSPIRSYIDIVVHRMVHAGLNGQDNPYTLDDLKMMCSHVNAVYGRAKKHSNACDHLRKTCKMMKTPLFLPGIVCEVTESNLQLLFPHLPHQSARESELFYSHLDVAVKPDVTDGAVDLTWQKRIYDARGVHPFAKTMPSPVKLNPNANVCKIPLAVWDKLQKAIVSNHREGVLNLGSEIAHQSDMQKRSQELTSEMQGGLPIVKHHASFTREFKQGSVVLVQMVAECKKGLIQPTIRLLKLTSEYSICVQHMKNPVACFADIATNHLKISYPSIEEYQRITLPILQMEAASNCVADSDPIVISNAQISLRLSNGKYYGLLELPMTYCKPRQISLFKNSKDEECDFHDFLCLRCPFSDDSGNKLMWVGHAVQTKATTTDKRDIAVEFGINHMNEPPPGALTNGRTTCHIELLAKTLPDRRMEEAVNDLPGSSYLCKAIVVGQNPPKPREDWKELCPQNLDISVDSECPFLPENNERQKFAIRKALTERFTIIQGPPGTGKTITGIKLAYWYCQVNAKQAERTSGPRRQVLYCGPSNSAIDVAAKMLKRRLGSKCPKILRVYSGVLQNQVFPIPRDVNVVSKRDRNYQMLEKEDQKAIALHYLIRQNTNSYHAKILRFDKLFQQLKKKAEELTDEQIDEYQKLIADASVEEIKKYDIVLCTCAVSASACIVRAANITQIIIDECGMCMEPESLVPLVAHRAAEQVVLVGDHRQLRPIVKNATARELGLERSLFERYANHAVMLNLQYRMHNEICEFPSKHFYGGCLISPLKKSFVIPAMLVDRERLDGTRYEQQVNIWPNNKIPLVFCHVEGAEKTLSVSTDEGNEKSKSNEAERDHSTRIYRELVNNYKVPSEQITILTQYKAQCSEIERTLKDYGFGTPKVSTVVASQGSEWDYVIMSTVRSLPIYEIDKRPSIGWLKQNLGFIIDHHQINVALTRAIKGLIIVGNQNLLKCDHMWSELLRYYRERRCLVPAEDFLRPRDRRVYRRNIQRAEERWMRQFKKAEY